MEVLKGMLSCVLDKERYRIQLDAADGNPTVQQLAEQIFDVTKIPVSNQRLICKGKMDAHTLYLEYLHLFFILTMTRHFLSSKHFVVLINCCCRSVSYQLLSHFGLLWY